jgi:O-antigen ligase
LSHIVILAGCALAAYVFLAVVSGEKFVTVAIAGIAVVALLAWAIRRTTLDRSWLIFALVLGESLPFLNVLPFDPNSRWWIHYPILLGFCVPAAFQAWKAGIYKRSGFLMCYLLFLAWAAVSITYSMYPQLSASRILRAALLFGALNWIAAGVSSSEDIQRILERYLAANAILVVLNLIAAIAFPHNVVIEDEALAAGVVPIGIFTWTQDSTGLARFCGFSGGPNEIGGLMACTVGAGVAHWHALSGDLRRALACVMTIAVVLAVMADSRSSFVAVGVGLFGICVWHYRLRGLAACLGAIVLLGVIYAAVGPAQREYVNRDVDTLTGRTVEWHFELRKIAERPLLGYGYNAEGAIFEDPHFSEWTAFAGGPRESLQNGYLSIAVGLGIPALIFWLFLYLAPWVSMFREQSDPWRLKAMFFLFVFPGLVYAFSESGVADPSGNLLPFLCWMLAERYRLALRATLESARFNLRDISSGAVDFRRLLARNQKRF